MRKEQKRVYISFNNTNPWQFFHLLIDALLFYEGGLPG